MTKTLINVLVNDHWVLMPEKNLQPESDSFPFKAGLYETIRTLEHKPVFLKPHLDRLFYSAKRTGLKIQYSQKAIKSMITKVVKDFEEPNQRCRILVNFDKVIIYTSSLNLEPSIYKGINTITVSTTRSNPEIKTTDYNACLRAWELAKKNGCFEALLSDKRNNIFEGSRSNVFWVKNNKIFTRENDVLPGVTRKTILEKYPDPIHYSKLNLLDFKRLNEVFLTNSGSGIIPVIKVNSIQIGDGEPGPTSKRLLKLYNTWLKNEI